MQNCNFVAIAAAPADVGAAAGWSQPLFRLRRRVAGADRYVHLRILVLRTGGKRLAFGVVLCARSRRAIRAIVGFGERQYAFLHQTTTVPSSWLQLVAAAACASFRRAEVAGLAIRSR